MADETESGHGIELDQGKSDGADDAINPNNFKLASAEQSQQINGQQPQLGEFEANHNPQGKFQMIMIK